MPKVSSQTPLFFVGFLFTHFSVVFNQFCLPNVLMPAADQKHHFYSLSVGILRGYIGQDRSFSPTFLLYFCLTKFSISPNFF